MIRASLYLYDMYVNHVIHLLVIFVAFVWIVFITKFIVSRRYKPIYNDFHDSVCVIVPVLSESPILFERCLSSIKQNDPDQIVVVFDKLENSKELMAIAKRYTTHILKAPRPGKRENIAMGVRYTDCNILIMVDSDTNLMPDSIKNIIKPFASKDVGGVVARHKIIDHERNLLSRFSNWIEDMRFNLTISAESVYGSIGCMPGRMAAYRKKVITPHIDELLNQKFMGNLCRNGDDRCLTSIVLKCGFKTVYQSSAVAYTDCPTNLKGFFRQQIRWSRGMQRGYILSLNWLYKRPFLMFCSTATVISPYFFITVISLSVYEGFTGDLTLNIPLHLSLVLSIVGMILSRSPRQQPHLKENISDVKYLPIYIVFTLVIMLSARVIGLLTINRNGWLTR